MSKSRKNKVEVNRTSNRGCRFAYLVSYEQIFASFSIYKQIGMETIGFRKELGLLLKKNF